MSNATSVHAIEMSDELQFVVSLTGERIDKLKGRQTNGCSEIETRGALQRHQVDLKREAFLDGFSIASNALGVRSSIRGLRGWVLPVQQVCRMFSDARRNC